MNTLTRNIPNAITCVNILSGTVAIVCATKLSTSICGIEAYQWAYIFIALAAIADFCDGFAARALKAYSPLGKELDSLCDLVSFGVAPAIILFSTLQEVSTEQWLPWTALMIAPAGALRLARFNTSAEENSYFTGLPIPANAIFWIGFTAWLRNSTSPSAWFIVVIIIAVSWLMISPIRLWSLKFKTYGIKKNWPRWSLVVAAPVFCICCGLEGLMWMIIYYILLSIATSALILNKKTK